MAITRTPIIDDDGTGTTGTVIDNAWKTELYNQIDGTLAGAFVVPHDPANFTAAPTGAWTVTGSSLRISVVGTVGLVTVDLTAAQASVTGAPVFLDIRVPGLGVTVKTGGPFSYYGPVIGTGYCEVAAIDAGSLKLSLLRDVGGTAWAAGSYYISVQLHTY